MSGSSGPIEEQAFVESGMSMNTEAVAVRSPASHMACDSVAK